MSKKKYTGIGQFIFGGSAYFGMKNAGLQVNDILEISDDILTQNSYHLIKNEKDLNVIGRTEWTETDIEAKYKGKIDIMFSNAPCSGLSSVNRHASADASINNYIVESAHTANLLEPKVLILENAPALISKGYPVLKEAIDVMKEKYNFTAIRLTNDTHGVPMIRQRTLFVAWLKSEFDNKVPLVNAMKNPKCVVDDILVNVDSSHEGWGEYIKGHVDPALVPFYKDVLPKKAMFESLAMNNVDIESIKESHASNYKNVKRIAQCLKEGKRYFGHGKYKMRGDSNCCSITSMVEYIHPHEDRDLNIAEFKALMGYPKDFKFYQDECKTSVVQCIAQGVAASTVEYIVRQAIDALEGKLDMVEDCSLVYQQHTKMQRFQLTYEDLDSISDLSKVTSTWTEMKK